MIEHPDILAERFAALRNPIDDSDWLEVRRRARGGRRWLAVPLAAALAAILVGSAFALYGRIVDFFDADPAPERVVLHFGQMSARAKIDFGPHVEAREARKIMDATIRGKRRSLYVAPTADGGFCWMWWRMQGSCARTKLHTLDAPLGAIWLEGPKGAAAQLTGVVLDPAVARVVVEADDGGRTEVEVVWVSPPIDAGFFIHEARDRPIVSLIGLDENGRELHRQAFHQTDPRWKPGPDGLPRIADRTKKRTLFDFRDHRGQPWKLVVAPAPGDRLCWAYDRGAGCTSPKFPPIIGGMSIQSGESMNLCCAVAEGVATVELLYEDGERTELKPVDGFLLYVIPPDRYPRGHRLETLVWRDADGREVDRRTFKTDQAGLYPCEESDEMKLGYGVSVCP